MTESFVVTTGLHPAAATEGRAIALAAELEAPYVERRGGGIVRILSENGAGYALIVQADRHTLSDGALTYSYHPNMLLVRGLNVARGWRDLYCEAAAFKQGESVLDCTLGFACEASLAAMAVGPDGHVTGLESAPALAAVTRAGLARFPLETPLIQEAMRRVHVVTGDYDTFLRDSGANSYDVVAFDPFFHERIDGSQHSVTPLARLGDNRPLNTDAVMRARVVARRRVVVKHPRFTPLPEELLAVRADVIESRKALTAYSLFDPVDD